MTPEFSRIVAIDTIGPGGREVAVEADADECAALARRFGWRGLDALEVDVALIARAAGIDAAGRLRAEVTQACVVTGEAVPATIDQDFALRFVAANLLASGEEVELSDADLDTIAYEGGAVDVGEAAAQTLALALDPFPKSRNADAALRQAGVVSEEHARNAASPFAALKGLIDP